MITEPKKEPTSLEALSTPLKASSATHAVFCFEPATPERPAIIGTCFVGSEAECRHEQDQKKLWDCLIVAFKALPKAENGASQHEAETKFLAVELFKKYGLQASYHYADDSGKEWQWGYIERDKALAVAKAFPQWEADFVEAAKKFLWVYGGINGN